MIWQGRNDPIRVHHIVKMGALDVLDKDPGVALLGFATDTGVARNLGRTGAALGPLAFRKAFANIPVHNISLSITDFGDITIEETLEKAQEKFQNTMKQLWKTGYTPFSIGGGHEISYPHYWALAETFPDKIIGIINLDAHLDLREPLSGSLSTSGSSFFQIHEYLQKQKKPFHYLCLGAQTFANTLESWEHLKNFKGHAILAEQISSQITKEKIIDFLNKVDSVYVTIDLDVFASPFSPGVSAPSPLGILPNEVLPLLRFIKLTGKMLAFDIAELNPQFDSDGMSAKLAALLAMELLTHKV